MMYVYIFLVVKCIDKVKFQNYDNHLPFIYVKNLTFDRVGN